MKHKVAEYCSLQNHVKLTYYLIEFRVHSYGYGFSVLLRNQLQISFFGGFHFLLEKIQQENGTFNKKFWSLTIEMTPLNFE